MGQFSAEMAWPLWTPCMQVSKLTHACINLVNFKNLIVANTSLCYQYLHLVQCVSHFLTNCSSWLNKVYFGVGKASDIVYDNFPQWATNLILIFMLCIYVCTTVHTYSNICHASTKYTLLKVYKNEKNLVQ